MKVKVEQLSYLQKHVEDLTLGISFQFESYLQIICFKVVRYEVNCFLPLRYFTLLDSTCTKMSSRDSTREKVHMYCPLLRLFIWHNNVPRVYSHIVRLVVSISDSFVLKKKMPDVIIKQIYTKMTPIGNK